MHHSTIHILADFDRTFTMAHVDGKKTPSLISVLRDNNFLDEEYSAIATRYFDQYASLENDPSRTFEERKASMHERWSRHFDLLVEKGLSKDHIHQVVTGGYIQLRPGASEFIQRTNDLGVPIVFISSSGLGAECIRQFLNHNDLLLPHIHIISNEYIWNNDGTARGVQQPIIHSLNKDETTLHEFPFYEEIAQRKNVLLLGDSLGDLNMIEGFSYESLKTLGFLNDLPEASDEKKKAYNDAFDVVITGDGSFEQVSKAFEAAIA